MARQCACRECGGADAGEAAPERLVYPVEANEMFLKVERRRSAHLRAQGFDFYDWGPGEIRLVTSWDQQGRGASSGSPPQPIAAL